MKYPIAETFLSLQGEGTHAGQVQFFIRFAGCSVGKKRKTQIPGVSDYIEECCTYDGRSFLCDTDYRTKAILTVDDLLNLVPWNVHEVTLTGGEPFIHDLRPLLDALRISGKNVNIETSGTIYPEWLNKYHWVWITCSPKKNHIADMVYRADELKILVDPSFPEKLPAEILVHPNVYVQPINGENDINDTNLQYCIKLLMEGFVEWKLSNQNHKLWRIR